MRIIVNHLTRMQPGYICVAGIDEQTRKHIRPVLNHRLGRELLLAHGGPFDIGAIVDLGEAIHEGIAPEIEDYRFLPPEASYAGNSTPDAFWSLLNAVAKPHLSDIFGYDLHPNGGTCAVDHGKGTASLGCVVPLGQPIFYVAESIRLRVNDGVFDVSVPVTDLRLYEADHKTPRLTATADIARRLSQGVSVILSVGLSRPWRKPGDNQERHWLQVNGVHLRDNPIWQVNEGVHEHNRY